MDVWLAKSDKPTPVLVSIHGGGFRDGNKSVSPDLLAAMPGLRHLGRRHHLSAVRPGHRTGSIPRFGQGDPVHQAQRQGMES